MSPGKTCFTGTGDGSAIDYAIMDHTLAPWFWHMGHLSKLDTGLATHLPVRWSLKWAWKQKVEVHVNQGRTTLEREIGPCHPQLDISEAQFMAEVQAARVLWDKEVIQGAAPGPCQIMAINNLMDKWHSLARAQAGFFLEEPPKDTVGGTLATKWVDPASLVRSARSASRWSKRVQATKWCLRRGMRLK